MLDFPLMPRIKLLVEKINPQSDKFAMGVGSKGTGDSRLNNSPKNIFHFTIKLKIGMQQEIFGVKRNGQTKWSLKTN